jgi:hypothetical protein
MLLGGCLWAGAADNPGGDPAAEVHAMIEGMHDGLMDGKADAVRAYFDPGMAGFKRLSSDIGALLKESLAPSAIDFISDTGDSKGRDLELDWRMRIRAYSGEWMVERPARVKLRAEKRDGRWRVVSFAPMDFFTPARGGAVWDLISELLGSLAEGNSAVVASGSPRTQGGGNPAAFLAAFDRRMPGYEQLSANVAALLRQGDVNSLVELAGSQGDDHRRTLDLDWVLSMTNQDTGIEIFRRHERVKCEVERQGGKWRIVAFDPLEFLAPEHPR